MASPVQRESTGLHMADWMLLRAELDWVYDGKIDPQFRRFSEHMPGQSIFLLHRGTLLIRTRMGTVQARAGEWILPTQQERLQEFSDDAEVLSIHLQLHWPGGEPLFKCDVATKLESAQAPQLKLKSQRLLRFIEKEFPGARSLLPRLTGSLSQYARLRSTFNEWFCAFIETLLKMGLVPTRLEAMDPRVLRAVQILDHFPFGAPFRDSEFARQMDLSPTHLDRLFVKQFEMTPRQYLEKRKLEQAMMRVRATPSSGLLKSVAYDLGFNSLSHFSNWFRQKKGISATEYQQRYLE